MLLLFKKTPNMHNNVKNVNIYLHVLEIGTL